MDYSILRQQILNDIKNDPIAKGNSKALGYMIQNNAATYQTAADYSKILGDVVSKNINNNIPDGIPDNELAEFADECLVPIYKESQDTMLNACKNIQQIYNNQAEIGLKPVDVKRDDSRTQNISKRFSEAEKYDDVSFLTNENVSRSITRGAVQDSIRENSKMQSDAGLKIRLSRSDGSGCCQWCSGLVGDYDSFEKLPADFWKIHRNCNCVIDYNVGKTGQKIKYLANQNKISKIAEDNIETAVRSVKSVGTETDPKPLFELDSNPVNPNYKGERTDPYSKNCPSSVVAKEEQLRGNDKAQSIPYEKGKEIKNMDEMAELWEGAKPQKLELKDIDKLEDGRYVVTIDDTSREGHTVLLERKNGKSQIFDAQPNTVYNDIEGYLKYQTDDENYDSFKYFRVDDKILSSKGKTYFQEVD